MIMFILKCFFLFQKLLHDCQIANISDTTRPCCSLVRERTDAGEGRVAGPGGCGTQLSLTQLKGAGGSGGGNQPLRPVFTGGENLEPGVNRSRFSDQSGVFQQAEQVEQRLGEWGLGAATFSMHSKAFLALLSSI